MNNSQKKLPYWKVYGYFCQMSFGVFFVNIGQAMLIFIYCYSDLVSWWIENSRKMALAQEIRKIATNILSSIVEYEYYCPIYPLVFSGWILIKLQIINFSELRFSVLVSQNSMKFSLAPEIWIITTNILSLF